MLVFVEQVIISAMTFFSCNLSIENPLKRISINDQESKRRPWIANVNSNDPVFFLFSINTSKCSGSCNNINDPYAKLCIPDVVKNLNVRVFSLMSRTNETR